MKHFQMLVGVLMLGAALLKAQAQRTATATAILAGQFVVDATVTDSGSGYVAPPLVTISGGGGNGAIAVAEISNGTVTKIRLNQAGSGYTNAPAIIIGAPLDFITQGLIAYYPLDANAHDAVGNNPGTVFGGGARPTTNRFGAPRSAYQFDGNGSYIATAHALPEMTSATVSLWVSMDDWTGYQYLYFEGDSSGGHDFAGAIGGNYGVVTKDNSNTIIHNWLPPIHTWTHLVTVADAATHSLQIWVDGVLRATNTFAGQANIGYHSEFDLGRRSFYNDSFLVGSLDDVRIYNRALSGPEVAALHAMESGKTVDISIAAKTYQLTMTVIPGRGYQLQSSGELHQWNSVGDVFFPTNTPVLQEVETGENSRYWRLLESP